MSKYLDTISKNDHIIEAFLKLDGMVYDVRPDGSVWTLKDRAGHLTSIWRLTGCNHDGYRVLTLKLDGKRYALNVHRIVYRKFKGALEAGKVVNHIDGNGLNNSPENLELVSPSINNLHSYARSGRASNRGASKVSREMADRARELHLSGHSYRQIMKMIPEISSKGHCSDIINNRIHTRDATIQEKYQRLLRKRDSINAQISYLEQQMKG